MEPTAQTAAAERVWHLPRRTQEGTRGFKVAAREQHGHSARRHDLGIGHLLLGSFRMAERLQEVSPHTVDREDFLAHGSLLCWGRWVAIPYPGGGIPWMSIGRNLGYSKRIHGDDGVMNSTPRRHQGYAVNCTSVRGCSQ